MYTTLSHLLDNQKQYLLKFGLENNKIYLTLDYSALWHIYISGTLDLDIFKPSYSLTKVTLIKYFGKEEYKLLDQRTRAIFKSQNIISEEETTYIIIYNLLYLYLQMSIIPLNMN